MTNDEWRKEQEAKKAKKHELAMKQVMAREAFTQRGSEFTDHLRDKKLMTLSDDEILAVRRQAKSKAFQIYSAEGELAEAEKETLLTFEATTWLLQQRWRKEYENEVNTAVQWWVRELGGPIKMNYVGDGEVDYYRKKGDVATARQIETGQILATLAGASTQHDSACLKLFEYLLADELFVELLKYQPGSLVSLGVDYHPSGILHDAAVASGIDTGIACFPAKTNMQVKPGLVRVSAGYRAHPQLLYANLKVLDRETLTLRRVKEEKDQAFKKRHEKALPLVPNYLEELRQKEVNELYDLMYADGGSVLRSAYIWGEAEYEDKELVEKVARQLAIDSVLGEKEKASHEAWVKEHQDLVGPRYAHECKNCQFLGRFGEHDLYYCLGALDLNARFGNGKDEYKSSAMPVQIAADSELFAAREVAIEKRLMEPTEA